MSFVGKICAVGLGVLVLVWAALVIDVGRTDISPTPVFTFDACLTSSGTVSETLPKVCTTSDARRFTEPRTNEESLVDVIRVTTPRPDMRIKNPLVVEGFARGTWFFEGSFPVSLTDEHGVVIASGPAYAQTEWMTSNFVPFRAELIFPKKEVGVGRLLLKKDNPSGDTTKDQSLTMLLHFLGKYTESVATTTKAGQ
jgi:hypothetical protein